MRARTDERRVGNHPLPPLAVSTVQRSAEGRINVFADYAGALPAIAFAQFDAALTTARADRPWVQVEDLPRALKRLCQAVLFNPVAAGVMASVLRLTEALNFDDALRVESLAYSTLLGGSEFKRWRARTPKGAPSQASECPLSYERSDADAVTLWLEDAAHFNVFTHRMRDALAEALDTCLIDPTRPSVTLRARGRAFCVGGDLDEFGTAQDLAVAHVIRTTQSPAARLHRLGERGKVVVQGAAIGSGVELAAAAAVVEASSKSWFCLPELGMGLIPGAGGMATIPARIGRHRTFFLFAGSQRIRAQTALEWGLVDAVTPS